MASYTDSIITPSRGTPYQNTVAIQDTETVYGGCLVAIDTTSGQVVDADDVATQRAVSILAGIKNSSDVLGTSTGNSDGTVEAVIEWGHEVLLDLDTPLRDAAALQTTVYVKDNHTVTDAATAAHDLAAGTLMSFVSSSSKLQGWVLLNRPAPVEAISV